MTHSAFDPQATDIYGQFGMQPIINAMGHVTVLGGSILSPTVQAAMDAANTGYATMEDLFEQSGRMIAQMLGAEAALVTSGAYAALVTGMAGIMAGTDPTRIAQLPDTTGMKNEFLIPKQMRYRYDRAITTTGARLVEVGDDDGFTAQQLDAAIGPQTAGILYFARMDSAPGALSIPQVVEIAHGKGIQVILDAAGEIYPLERFTWLPQCGADLICFGAKYLGSANSTGIICGKARAVQAARLNGFLAYESHNNRSIGRGYKVDRQEIIGTTVALHEWLNMDHEERLQDAAARIDMLAEAVNSTPHATAANVWEEEGGPWMRMRIQFKPGAPYTAQQVADRLKAGDPPVWVRVTDDDIFIEVHTLREGEPEIVAQRLAAVLA